MNDKPETNPESTPSGAEDKPVQPMRLDHFLQACGVPTGGQAKILIQSGQVLLNGEVETRRRKKLTLGDEICFNDEVFIVTLAEEEEEPGDEAPAEDPPAADLLQ